MRRKGLYNVCLTVEHTENTDNTKYSPQNNDVSSDLR